MKQKTCCSRTLFFYPRPSAKSAVKTLFHSVVMSFCEKLLVKKQVVQGEQCKVKISIGLPISRYSGNDFNWNPGQFLADLYAAHLQQLVFLEHFSRVQY